MLTRPYTTLTLALTAILTLTMVIIPTVIRILTVALTPTLNGVGYTWGGGIEYACMTVALTPTLIHMHTLYPPPCIPYPYVALTPTLTVAHQPFVWLKVVHVR